MRAVIFPSCSCGATFAPMMLDLPATEEGIATTIEGVCPICLLEIQVGLAIKKTTVPNDLSELT